MKNINPVLSLILPVYNVEKYLIRCLTSLLTQDIDKSEYEIIIVEDCSLDQSINIIKDFLYIHSNITLVSHKRNKGLGAARNTGLNHAKGKYVWFVDSDDFIEQNKLKFILSQFEKDKLDVLSFNLFTQDKYLQFNQDIANALAESMVMDGKTFLKSHYQPSAFSSCSKIYCREYLFGRMLIGWLKPSIMH